MTQSVEHTVSGSEGGYKDEAPDLTNNRISKNCKTEMSPTLFCGFKSITVLPFLIAGICMGSYGRLRNHFSEEDYSVHVPSWVDHNANSLHVYCRMRDMGAGKKFSRFFSREIYEDCFYKFVHNGKAYPQNS